MKLTPTELVVCDHLLSGSASFYSLLRQIKLKPDRLNEVLAGVRQRGLIEWVHGGNETKVRLVRPDDKAD